MEAQHAGIITLLRSALNSESLALPDGFDWNGASKLILEHHLTGLAVCGASLCGVPRSHPAVVGLTAAFCKDLQVSRSQMKALGEVFSLFDANGIHYMPIKGAVIKALYPRPEYRIMGDADILIRPEQYPRIRELLTEAGMQEVSESDYELVWNCPDLKLELHTCLVPPQSKTYYSFYRDSWRFAHKNGSGSGYHMTAEDHFVFLFAHFAKHYLIGSICAKDICDFWVWKKAYPHMDEAYILRQLDQLQLRKFYGNLLQLLDFWFGGQPATETVERISHTAFCGGISDDYNVSFAKGNMERHAEEGDSLLRKKVRWFCNALFPSCSSLSHRYKILKKLPVLLPLFWVVNWCYVLFCEWDRLKRGVVVMKMNDQDYSEYNEHLTSVGLVPEESDER